MKDRQMLKRILFSSALTLLCFVSVSAERVILQDSPHDVNVDVVESNQDKTVINYNINAFDKSEIVVNAETMYQINCGNEGRKQVNNYPE